MRNSESVEDLKELMDDTIIWTFEIIVVEPNLWRWQWKTNKWMKTITKQHTRADWFGRYIITTVTPVTLFTCWKITEIGNLISYLYTVTRAEPVLKKWHLCLKLNSAR